MAQKSYELRAIDFTLVGRAERKAWRMYVEGEFRGVIVQSPYDKEFGTLHGELAAEYNLRELCALRGPDFFRLPSRKGAVRELLEAGPPARFRGVA